MLIGRRDEAVSYARRSNHPEDRRTEKALKNRCTNILRTEKCRYLKNKLDTCEEEKDVMGVLKNIKTYLGWGNVAGAPTELTNPLPGQQTNSPKQMANIQNKYYKDKVAKIRQQNYLQRVIEQQDYGN